MRKIILTFSGIIAALLILFRIGKYSLGTQTSGWEILLAIIALVFLLLGIYLRPKKRGDSQINTPFKSDIEQARQLGISKRELEILGKIAEGLSNKEIGEVLFVSENTVKTHTSNIFQKLNVKRRTQAVQKAKELKLIP